MPGTLVHSAADIVRSLLVQAGLGTYPPNPPTAPGAWPVYVFSIPLMPDSLICVYDTGGRTFARDAFGHRAELHGVMVKIRSVKSRDGFEKGRAIAVAMDALQPTHVNVTDPDREDGSYYVQNVMRTSDVLALGEEKPEGTDKTELSSSKRMVFSVNFLVNVKTYGS